MKHTLSRRGMLALTLGAGIAATARAAGAKTVLLHSGWQTVNIGDIAHTPGVLALLEKHLPGAKILYWPKSIDRGVASMLRARFPQVEIVEGDCDAGGAPRTEALRRAFAAADLLVHGSGPSLVGHAALDAWRRQSDKPYGVYGVTLQDISGGQAELLNGAAFVFTRETHSLRNLAGHGITQPATGFAPDGTFAFDLRDDAKGGTYLKAKGLEARKFICVVPRLRYTPYHKIRKVSWSAEEIARREAHNAKYAETDHAKLREVIVRWVRDTGLRVLVCPEMTYELDIIGPLVVGPLPEDVKASVVGRDTYWLPDEAASVYAQACAVISMECHSPILAAAAGTPCMYMRQPEDTIKGQMWYDVGLTDWVFEIEETQGQDIAGRVMEIHKDFKAAQAYLARAMALAAGRHRETMAVVRG